MYTDSNCGVISAPVMGAESDTKVWPKALKVTGNVCWPFYKLQKPGLVPVVRIDDQPTCHS